MLSPASASARRQQWRSGALAASPRSPPCFVASAGGSPRRQQWRSGALAASPRADWRFNVAPSSPLRPKSSNNVNNNQQPGKEGGFEMLLSVVEVVSHSNGAAIRVRGRGGILTQRRRDAENTKREGCFYRLLKLYEVRMAEEAGRGAICGQGEAARAPLLHCWRRGRDAHEPPSRGCRRARVPHAPGTPRAEATKRGGERGEGHLRPYVPGWQCGSA